MAKLTGVKTIDMVGGEITKVEYNGELYAKVDGDAKEGDLLLATSHGVWDVDPGDFFAVKSDGGYFDNNDDERNANHEDLREYYRYFRKVSTQAPTLESRVETLETKVAALEEKPKKEPLKVGDYVVGIDGDRYSITNTEMKLAEVIGVSGSEIDLKVLVHTDSDWVGDEFEEVESKYFRKATEEEVTEARKNAEEQAEIQRWSAIGRKPNEFKKGDIVHADRDYAEFTVLSVDEILSGVVSFESRKVRLEDVGLVVPVESRFDR